MWLLPIQRIANSVKKCGERDKSRDFRFWHPRLKIDHRISSVRPELKETNANLLLGTGYRFAFASGGDNKR